MPTNITQLDEATRGKTVLRVEGALELADALLLEKIALDVRAQTGASIIIDFADLHFMDSESAPVVKRLEREHAFEIVGIEYFLQRVVSETENNGK